MTTNQTQPQTPPSDQVEQTTTEQVTAQEGEVQEGVEESTQSEGEPAERAAETPYEPEVVSIPSPAPTKAPVTVAQTITQPTLEDIQEQVSTCNAVVRASFEMISEYMVAMKPGRQIDPVIGGKHQATLFRTIVNLINGAGEDFPVAFDALLKLFWVEGEQNHVFHPQYVMRFMEFTTLAEKDRKGFARLMNLLTNTADPRGRRLVVEQSVRVNKSLEFDLSEIGRRNVLNFYEV